MKKLVLPIALLASLPVPGLTAEAPCKPAPFGAATLYLRGSMNNWSAADPTALRYRCDAYYVDVKASGRHEFKLADTRYTPATTVGALKETVAEIPADARPVPVALDGDAAGSANLAARFAGTHTIRLAVDANGRPQLSIGPASQADAGVAIDDPVARSLAFDSRDPGSKKPFGAVKAGTPVAFSLAALPGVSAATLVVELRAMEGNQDNLRYAPVARIPMAQAGQGGSRRWSASHMFADIGVYGYYFEVQAGGKTWVYQNNDDLIYWTREAGSNGKGAVAAMPAQTDAIRRFRQTVFLPGFRVPDWARDAIVYHIFPDRFRNGDPGNDPRPGVDTYQDRGVELHRNWLERPYRPGSGDGSDSSHNNDFYGGDLRGVIDKLDYIADLGVNTLYLTPLFRAASNHKYDTADYRNIDPHFGSNEDFIRLAGEARRRGLRLIVDTSFNHTGTDSIYFDRYDRYGRHGTRGAFKGGKVRPDSPYADWYAFDPANPVPEQQYRGWTGVPDLPELNKMSPAFRRFAYEAPDSVTRLWLQRGAAGWRMDVAPWVPDDFWRGWRKAVKAHDPQAITVAETWFEASKFFLGDSFDSTMNYILRNAVLDYAAGADARVVYRNVELMREAYPQQVFHALMNLLSTHDQPRALHHLGYRTEADGAAKLDLAKRRLRLALLFQMSFPGAPSVYYGDEVGVAGGEDPDNRATYPWPDLGGKPDQELLAYVKALVKLRRDTPVLRRGSIAAPLLLERDVIALARQDGAQWALVLTNNADAARTVDLPLPAGMRGLELVDALGGGKLATRGGRLRLELPALSGTVLLGSKPPDHQAGLTRPSTGTSVH
ncbi:MAG: alpha-amylase family glycosyl hydrolase [Telluria sp.]